MLNPLRVSSFEYLESRSTLLRAGLADAAKEAGISVTIRRVGWIISSFFAD
ncbi:MAG: hypothetical protein ACYS80_17165 [Planctomycetota bacterium]